MRLSVSRKETVGCLPLWLNLPISVTTDPCVMAVLGAKQCLFLWGVYVSVVEDSHSVYGALASIPQHEGKTE